MEKYVALMVICIAGSFVNVYLARLGAGPSALHLTGFITGGLAMLFMKVFE